MRSKPARAIAIGGLGVAGLVGGHALGYALTVPDPYHRSTVLAATGHGYFSSASWIAVVVGIAALVAGVAAGYFNGPRAAKPRYARVALRLVVLQCLGFVLLELSERALSAAPASSLSPRLIVAGLLSQVVCALLAALVVVGLRRLGAALAAKRRLPSETRSHPFVTSTDRFPASRTTLRERVRGPPAEVAV